MPPVLVLGKKKEEVMRSLVNAASSVTVIRNSITNLSELGEERFKFIEMELCNIAWQLFGEDGCEEVFDAANLESYSRKKQ